jgi:hypothetical protein
MHPQSSTPGLQSSSTWNRPLSRPAMLHVASAPWANGRRSIPATASLPVAMYGSKPTDHTILRTPRDRVCRVPEQEELARLLCSGLPCGKRRTSSRRFRKPQQIVVARPSVICRVNSPRPRHCGRAGSGSSSERLPRCHQMGRGDRGRRRSHVPPIRERAVRQNDRGRRAEEDW